MQPSKEYYELIDAYKIIHQEEGKFRGISLTPLVPTLINLTKENNCKTLLDYGCGKAIPYDKDKCNEMGLKNTVCLLYTSPSPRDGLLSRMPSSA